MPNTVSIGGYSFRRKNGLSAGCGPACAVHVDHARSSRNQREIAHPLVESNWMTHARKVDR